MEIISVSNVHDRRTVYEMKTDQRGAVTERRPEAPQSPREQWEYRSSAMELGSDLSQFGAEGWCLVSMVPLPADPMVAMYVFRRRRT